MGIFRQFPYSNFHEMNMDTILEIIKGLQEEWAATKTEWASYKDFIDNYFANLDVSEEVLENLRAMLAAGELDPIIDPAIAVAVAAWLAEHITPTTPIVDDTLSISGAAADALITGKIAGAATDVLLVEPPKDGNVLLNPEIPNLLITPHSAWGSVDARQRIVQQMVENVEAFKKGQPIRQVNA